MYLRRHQFPAHGRQDNRGEQSGNRPGGDRQQGAVDRRRHAPSAAAQGVRSGQQLGFERRLAREERHRGPSARCARQKDRGSPPLPAAQRGLAPTTSSAFCAPAEWRGCSRVSARNSTMCSWTRRLVWSLPTPGSWPATPSKLLLVVRANYTDRRTAQAAVQRLFAGWNSCDGSHPQPIGIRRAAIVTATPATTASPAGSRVSAKKSSLSPAGPTM